MYAEKAYLNAFVRYCHLLQAKASSCVLRCTVCFFSVDVTARQRLDRFSPNLHQQTSLQHYSLMVVLP